MLQLFVLSICLGLAYHIFSRGRSPMPPGPPKLPVIGNLLDMPFRHDWEEFSRWGDLYGPLVSVSTFTTNVVIINTYKKALEILDKKSPIYSCRPYLPMVSDLMGWSKSLGFLPYGARLRQTRKIFHQELGKNSGIRTFYPHEEAQAQNFIRLCVRQPERLREHCLQHAGAIILRVAYGYTAKDKDDEMIKAANDAMATLGPAIAPGYFLVNQIPILRFVPEWFPGANFKRQARIWAPLYDAMVDIPFNYVIQQLSAGTAEESFTAKWLQRNLSDEDKDILKHGSGAMFGAGSETASLIPSLTASTIYAFFLVMCLYPNVQRRAQAEVDSAVGRDRLPTYADQDKMPYLEALMKEILRRHISVPTGGLPHTTTENDIHDGYFVPKGSIVLANIWKMARDSEIYKDPEAFNPERFTGSEPEQDPREYIFGFGRRICPGRLLANATVFITISTCLSVFDISPTEEDGKPVLPEYKAMTGTIGQLAGFKCKITPRFSEQKLAQLLDG
uniref:Cytochrome P450 n=1 Tax=Moniliophthora roreri TaxID=221103 RepID=A0A0W0F3X1_MONRR